MMFRPLIKASLVTAALTGSCFTFAAPQIIQSHPDVVQQKQVAARSQANEQALADMLFQLQQLQQEVMSLRGVVDEQSHQIDQLKKDAKDRYVDLDRRLSDVQAAGGTSPAGQATVAASKVSQEEQDRYDHARDLIRQKQYEASVAEFDKFIKDYPESTYVPNALYYKAKVYLVMQDYKNARESFASVVSDYPQFQKYPDALYELATLHAKFGENSKAEPLFKSITELYPDTQLAAKARTALKSLK